MRSEKLIGILLIVGSLLLFFPYTILIINFDYPQILRGDAGFVLTRFYEGGTPLIVVWWLAVREMCKIVFLTIHQYGGVILGEHIGQLFTVIWVLIISNIFNKLRIMPKWIVWTGYASAFIYALAQAELFATVIPGFPVWDMAGLFGSTLWLIWMIIVGIQFLKLEKY